MQLCSHFHKEKPTAAMSGAQHRRLRSSECLRQSQNQSFGHCELLEFHELVPSWTSKLAGAVFSYAHFDMHSQSLKYSVSQ